MVDYQIEMTVDLILNDNVALNLTFEDFKIIIDRFLKGRYGKAYDRFDGQVFFECVNSYAEEKQSIILQRSDLLHDQAKSSTNVSIGINKDNLTRLAEELRASLKEVAKPKVEKPVREKDPKEKYIQKTFRDFDKLFDDKGIELRGSRFIKKYGKILSQVEYMEHKAKQYDRIKIFFASRLSNLKQ